MAATIGVDWDWVRLELIRLENIRPHKDDDAKFEISTALDDGLDKTRSLASPKAISIQKRISRLKPCSIVLDDGTLLHSSFLSSYLKAASSLCAFLVTIGDGIEKTATGEMNQGEYLRGYLLDRIGSLAVESLAENYEEFLRNEFESNNLSVSMRFSPGYCDWPIEEQFKISRILDFSKIGVRLTEACMMVPRKSISAVVGIGPEGAFSKTESQCVVCDKKICDYRRG